MASPSSGLSVTGNPTPVSDASPAHLDDPSALPRPKQRRGLSDNAVSATPSRRPKPQAPESGSRRKLNKVSRACDFCKLKKLRCTGTLPCQICIKKGLECQYDAQYRRGRPPTPPPAVSQQREVPIRESQDDDEGESADEISRADTDSVEPIPAEAFPSRGSPELDTTEIEGQFFDPTSNLTFLHRAWKRLSLQKGANVPGILNGSESMQPLMSAGDRPFAYDPNQGVRLPDRQSATELLEYYFDRCVVTYRCLNSQLCSRWLSTLLSNAENNLPFFHDIGHAKAAVILEILAIASLRQNKIAGNWSTDDGSGYYLQQSDQFFCGATALTNEEKGLPRLESVQARILQVLYLLQTARMNQAWYVFGSVVPIVSALGLHRKASRERNGTSRSPNVDYIASQGRKRTFWVVYTIDKYLSVVLGRPRLYHDDDIDQEYPDKVNDEDMTPQGPSLLEPSMDCHIDSLIFHAKIARIVDSISREVYSLKNVQKHERLAAAQKLVRTLHEWRDELPPHLGTVRPRSLIPSFRRQATALKLAYCHAVMHANRPFLLGSPTRSNSQNLSESVTECITAARMALETVDSIVCDGALFHSLWWTPYVTFCALAVVYVWEIQQKKSKGELASDDPFLFELAERCQSYLAQSTAGDSPSRRYSIILDELRLEARHGRPAVLQGIPGANSVDQLQNSDGLAMDIGSMFQEPGEDSIYQGLPMVDEWQATDWLDLDSSISKDLLFSGRRIFEDANDYAWSSPDCSSTPIELLITRVC
uniref:Zn(2)-C6 fungal-type domain-containing protein n=1 Tax=Bionectria ochroleuca TaxID=29856 RepID=A0A0B7KQW2_BIOOC